MTTRVLVPMDDSEMARGALRFALEHHPDAEITVMHVVGEPSSMFGVATGLALADDLDEAAEELAAETLAAAEKLATEYDREIDTRVRVGHPVRAICEVAEDFDVVIVGSHGGSLADRLFVGNVTEKVMRRSPVPVTVVR